MLVDLLANTQCFRGIYFAPKIETRSFVDLGLLNMYAIMLMLLVVFQALVTFVGIHYAGECPKRLVTALDVRSKGA